MMGEHSAYQLCVCSVCDVCVVRSLCVGVFPSLMHSDGQLLSMSLHKVVCVCLLACVVCV